MNSYFLVFTRTNFDFLYVWILISSFSHVLFSVSCTCGFYFPVFTRTFFPSHCVSFRDFLFSHAPFSQYIACHFPFSHFHTHLFPKSLRVISGFLVFTRTLSANHCVSFSIFSFSHARLQLIPTKAPHIISKIYHFQNSSPASPIGWV